MDYRLWTFAGWFTLLLAVVFQLAGWFVLEQPIEPFSVVLAAIGVGCLVTVRVSRNLSYRRLTEYRSDESDTAI